MEILEYGKVITTQWKVVVLSAVIGAVVGATIAFTAGTSAETQGTPTYEDYADVVALTDSGAQEFTQALRDSTHHRITATLEITNPADGITADAYRELAASMEVAEAAAEGLGVSVEEITDSTVVSPGGDGFLVTITSRGSSSETAQAYSRAVIDSYRQAIRRTEQGSTSRRFLVSTRSPNPQLLTDANYTASRVPTYLALANSPEFGAPGIRTSRIEDTSILSFSTDGDASDSQSGQVIAEFADRLQAAIGALEDGPVSFVDLGPGAAPAPPSARRVSIEASPPTIALGANPNDDARSRAQVLALVAADNATIIAPDIDTVVADLRDNTAVAAGLPDSTRLEFAVAPELAEGEALPPLPRAQTIRILTTGESQDDSQTALQQAVTALTENNESGFVLVQAPVVATPALAGTETVQPATDSRLAINTILGLLLGAAAGVAYVLWSNSRKGTIDTASEFERFVGVSPLGIIVADHAEQPLEGGGIGFQALRANILFGLEAPRTIAVAGPTSDSGVYEVAQGLAHSFRNAQRDVSILDPGPTTSSKLQIPDGEHVIVVCPPLTEDPAAAEIAAQCEATFLVVRVQHTTRWDVDVSARVLMQTATQVAGVVVTDVPRPEVIRWSALLPAPPAQEQAAAER